MNRVEAGMCFPGFGTASVSSAYVPQGTMTMEGFFPSQGHPLLARDRVYNFPTTISQAMCWLNCFPNKTPGLAPGGQSIPPFSRLPFAACPQLGEHTPSYLQGFCSLFDITCLQSKQNVPSNTHHAKFINEGNHPGGPTQETLGTCQRKLFKHSTRQIIHNDISHNEVKIIFSFWPFQPLLWTADRNYFLTLLPEQRSVQSGVYLFNMMISSSTSRQQIVGGVNKGSLKGGLKRLFVEGKCKVCGSQEERPKWLL